MVKLNAEFHKAKVVFYAVNQTHVERGEQMKNIVIGIILATLLRQI
jgi:hypothetical protein